MRPCQHLRSRWFCWPPRTAPCKDHRYHLLREPRRCSLLEQRVWSQHYYATSSQSVKFRSGGSPLAPHNSGNDIEPWLDRIDAVLPPHLRVFTTGKAEHLPPYQAIDVANLLSEARRLRQHDLLLAFAQAHRWRELVWLVTYLIDNLWHGNPTNAWKVPESPLSGQVSLDDFICNPSDLDVSTSTSSQSPRTLDQALSIDHPLTLGPAKQQYAGHQLLGEIWQSLGNMILEDKRQGHSIQPGILEIIAVLHSRNVMPDAIYSYTPSQSSTAGSQPPTLHLLSSQIMTNLSDAVWRAREATAVEEAHKQGRPAVFMGPELPSSNYRVRVAGIRHEIWLELVLWSCLHGGWVRPGGAILDEVMKQKSPSWSPMSWREMMDPLVKVGQEASIDRDGVDYRVTGKDDSDKRKNGLTVENTISSEVISAYVDGMINHVSVGVGSRGLHSGNVVGLLVRIKNFLTKNRFSLEATSWDAIIQRVLESESIDVEAAASLTERLLTLSSTYGEEKSARNTPTRDEAWRPLAPYLVDGSALSIGVTHRVLKAYIDRGNFAAAFYTLQNLQMRTDENKRLSMAAFFKQIRKAPPKTPTNAVEFESPYSQAFPAFYTMLPVDVLAPFLDLITEVGAFEFGKWLLASHDIDGPVIGPHAYRDRDMSPAIIRFLAASKNEELLGQMLQRLQTDPQADKLPISVFIAILESQFRLGNPIAALAPIDNLFYSDKIKVREVETLIAVLAREALKAEDRESPVVIKLWKLLGQADGPNPSIRTSMAILLMMADDTMKELCLESVSLPARANFRMSIRSFNAVLDGCTSTKGSTAGRNLLCRFSRLANEISAHMRHAIESTSGIVRLTGRTRPGSVEVSDSDKVDFDIPFGSTSTSMTPPAEVHVTGHFVPDVSSVRIILTQRLRELRDGQESTTAINGTMAFIGFGDDVVEWCAALFRALGMQPKDVQQEIEGSYKDIKVREEE
ncbi:hypothetical protein BDZ85DRAFT_257733 [Elsinoe ampelina]|uniref:Uncharacterized protein n=1 Tax=Elsinoe ampelina TaxID=302913 RepID=A0A6A6GJK0_9PEZI|nr:hypothetical protein BDZ85DRAFT_257733 [Elsinoe ampelina]